MDAVPTPECSPRRDEHTLHNVGRGDYVGAKSSLALWQNWQHTAKALKIRLRELDRDELEKLFDDMEVQKVRLESEQRDLQRRFDEQSSALEMSRKECAELERNVTKSVVDLKTEILSLVQVTKNDHKDIESKLISAVNERADLKTEVINLMQSAQHERQVLTKKLVDAVDERANLKTEIISSMEATQEERQHLQSKLDTAVAERAAMEAGQAHSMQMSQYKCQDLQNKLNNAMDEGTRLNATLLRAQGQHQDLEKKLENNAAGVSDMLRTMQVEIACSMQAAQQERQDLKADIMRLMESGNSAQQEQKDIVLTKLSDAAVERADLISKIQSFAAAGEPKAELEQLHSELEQMRLNISALSGELCRDSSRMLELLGKTLRSANKQQQGSVQDLLIRELVGRCYQRTAKGALIELRFEAMNNIERLCSLMRDNQETEQVQLMGCRQLWSLISTSAENQMNALSCGAVEVVDAALKAQVSGSTTFVTEQQTESELCKVGKNILTALKAMEVLAKSRLEETVEGRASLPNSEKNL